MPWSGAAGSKTYSRTDGTRTGSNTWQQADAASVDIVSTDHDTHDQDIATALNQTLMKDGGNTATSNIPMGGFRHTNVGDALSLQQALTVKQAMNGAANYVPTVGGTANAITLTTGWTATAYAIGQTFIFFPTSTNSGATTINVDGLGVKNVYNGGSSLTGGEFISGKAAFVVYDGTQFQADYTSPTILSVGMISAWPTATIPSGWLECDGSAISRSTYAALYAVITTTYGAGDGSTTFNLPNYKDYFLRGFDAAGTDAASRTDRGDGTTGANVGTKQAGATESHTHTGTTDNDGSHSHAAAPSNGAGADNIYVFGGSGGNVGIPDSGSGMRLSGITIPSGGAHQHAFETDPNSGTETRPKNITVKWCILATPSAGLSAGSAMDIAGLTELAVPADDEADFLAVRDTSASLNKKILTKNLGFTQSGTGSTLRSLQSKLRDVVSVKDFGAAGDGVADDTAEIQAALDASDGKTCWFPDGTYLVSAALDIPTNCAVEMASNCIVRATATMTAVFLTNAAEEHLNNTISGGYIDCNDFADSGIWLKWFSMYRIEDVEIWDNLVYGIRLGLTAGTSSYEAFIQDVRVRRGLVSAPSNTVGIYFEKCGDSHVVQTIIMGQKYGISGLINDSKFDRVHVWNPQENGATIRAFSIGGGDNVLTQCQVDGDCSDHAFYLNGTRNVLLGCSVNHVSWGTDNDADVVYVEAGYHATVLGCMWKGYSGSVRWSADYTLGAAATIDYVGNKSLNITSTHGQSLSTTLSPTASDGAALGTSSLMWSDLYLASGGVLDFNAGDVTVTHSSNSLVFAGASNGYTFSNGAVFFGANAVPSTTDAAALGTTGFQWSDLFLATGGVINWNNGTETLTQSSGALTIGGAKLVMKATATAAASFNLPTGSAPTSPVDGDVWREDNTNTGLKVRINGVTKTITVT
jgi:microcystin-dependent protein